MLHVSQCELNTSGEMDPEFPTQKKPEAQTRDVLHGQDLCQQPWKTGTITFTSQRYRWSCLAIPRGLFPLLGWS